jgi:hypothetical protein
MMRGFPGRDAGLEVVEFVVITGLIMVVGLIIWQFMVFGHTQMITANAAREGARAASVCEDIDDAIDRTRAGYEAEWDYDPIPIPCLFGGQPVTIRVRLDLPTVLPQSGDIWRTWKLPKIQTRSVGWATCEDVDAIKFDNGSWIPLFFTCF